MHVDVTPAAISFLLNNSITIHIDLLFILFMIVPLSLLFGPPVGLHEKKDC